ncbi:uncharacterized protein BJX67DRAFT_381252 [Aspergillus lucknowensis]|uniref:F-box domain-containing protein n=1 Tax=Aspergillus lucknowensis TaxID=176173 RepID=A0ABR4LRZ5_9EURO
MPMPNRLQSSRSPPCFGAHIFSRPLTRPPGLATPAIQTSALTNLPCEILILIFADLSSDPISQVALALTCKAIFDISTRIRLRICCLVNTSQLRLPFLKMIHPRSRVAYGTEIETETGTSSVSLSSAWHVCVRCRALRPTDGRYRERKKKALYDIQMADFEDWKKATRLRIPQNITITSPLCHLFTLPNELLLTIFDNCDTYTKITLALTCKKLLFLSASIPIDLSLFNNRDARLHLLELVRPRTSSGAPARDSGWNICKVCVRLRPTSREFWERIRRLTQYGDSWDDLVNKFATPEAEYCPFHDVLVRRKALFFERIFINP